MTRLVRDRVSWLLYAQLGIFGFFLYGFGPVVPLLRDELGVSRTVAGLYGPALAVGAVLGGAGFTYLVRRLGRGRALWVSVVGMGLGVALLCLSTTVPGTLAATVVAMTFGIMVAVGIPAALAAYQGPAAAAGISESNALAAGMGLVAPLLIGVSVSAGLGWRPGMAGTLVLIALLAVAAWLTRVRLPDSGHAAPAVAASGVAAPGSGASGGGAPGSGASGGGASGGGAPGSGASGSGAPDGGVAEVRGRLPGRYWLAWGTLLATGSVEVSLSLWASEHLRERAGMAPGAAAAGMSAVLVGMVIGRLAGGRAALRVGVAPLMHAALAGSAVGFAIFWAAPAPWLAITGLVLCGLAISVHFPLGAALAIQASDGQPDLAMARNSYSMAVGFGVAPLALGALADRIGIAWAFLLAPACIAIAAGLVWQLSRAERRHSDMDRLSGAGRAVAP